MKWGNKGQNSVSGPRSWPNPNLVHVKFARTGSVHVLAPTLSTMLRDIQHSLQAPVQAITAGKRVRSETSISSGAVSVSSAAAELCQLKLPSHSFSDARLAIVGAGKMSTLLVKHLLSKVRLLKECQCEGQGGGSGEERGGGSKAARVLRCLKMVMADGQAWPLWARERCPRCWSCTCCQRGSIHTFERSASASEFTLR